jgi:hypothetical protein
MNLADFVDEVFQVLAAADIGLNVPGDGPAVRGTPPAPYLELPAITYGEPGPGLHRITDLALTVVVGPANNPVVARQALDLVSPSGSQSIRSALENATWTTVGTVYVRDAEPSYDTVQGGNPMLAYTFHLDVTGG